MPVTAANLEPLINMLNAIVQRQETIRQLAAQLHSSAVWRSPDGKLAVELSDEQRAQLAAIAHAYLDESDVLTATARAMLAAPPPGADAGGGP